MRLDTWLVENQACESRARAQALIMSGAVLVNDQPVTKAGYLVKADDEIRLRQKDHPYVSRGALKLKHALEYFHIQVEGKVCLDVGASTGGFTEVLLEKGAIRVHAVDVGKDQLAWKVRTDKRVKVYEECHAKDIQIQTLGERPQLVVVDVSFISLRKILPALVSVSEAEAEFVTLVKPQFEVGKEEVGKGGIVRDEKAKHRSVQEVIECGRELGLKFIGQIVSPILGGAAKSKTKGNEEFLVYWRRV